MPEPEAVRVRVLIANELADRLETITAVIRGLGHEVIADGVESNVGASIARLAPDVALIGVGGAPERALELIGRISHESICPVVALLPDEDPAFVHEAGQRGAFAFLANTIPEELQSVMDIAMQRFTEYHNLQGAFGRRAVIEQAKGILMARHAIGADDAFDMLRANSQSTGEKLIELAEALVHSHLLLSTRPASAEHAD